MSTAAPALAPVGRWQLHPWQTPAQVLSPQALPTPASPLDLLPPAERPALQRWIANTSPQEVADYLIWYAEDELARAAPRQPRRRLYGLRCPELLTMAHQLRAEAA